MNIKKTAALVLTVLIMFSGVSSAIFDAEDIFAPEADTLGLASRAAVLMDAATGEIVFAKDADTPYPAPGLHKLMTSVLIMEAQESGQLAMTEKALVSDAAARLGGSTAFLDRTEYSVKDLLQAVAMVSANDACLTLVEKVAGVEEKMVQNMNDKAKELGLSCTFVDTTGRNYQEALMSPTDLVKIGRELTKHKNYLSLSSEYVKSLEHPGGRLTELANPNRLVRFYSGCDGLGTGSAPGAGYAGVFTARRGEFRLLAVVMGAPDAQSRQADAQKLLDYGFATYKSTSLIKAGEIVKKDVEVVGGDAGRVNLLVAESYAQLLKKGEEKGIERVIDAPDKLAAPLSTNVPVGSITLKRDGEVVATIPLVPSADIESYGINGDLKIIISNWLGR